MKRASVEVRSRGGKNEVCSPTTTLLTKWYSLRSYTQSWERWEAEPILVLTRRGGTSFLRTCISCIQSNPQTVPAFNRTCRQYLRHLPSVPASPANATGESTNAVYRVVSDVDSRVHASNAYLRTNLRRNHHNTRFHQIHEVLIRTHRTCTVYRYFGQFRVGMTTTTPAFRMHIRDYPQQRSSLIVSPAVAFKPARR